MDLSYLGSTLVSIEWTLIGLEWTLGGLLLKNGWYWVELVGFVLNLENLGGSGWLGLSWVNSGRLWWTLGILR